MYRFLHNRSLSRSTASVFMRWVTFPALFFLWTRVWTPDYPYIYMLDDYTVTLCIYNHESQDYKEAVRVLEGESVFDGPLFPGYEGPDEDFQDSVNALASEVQRRRTEADRLLERTPGAELVAQLRIDAGDALDCLRQSNALTPLLNDAVKKFFGACLSTRYVWVHCFANDGSLKRTV